MNALRGVLKNLCPRCGQEHVFTWFVKMHPLCPGCGYVYERENGYFMGAIVFGYLFSAFSTVPTIVLGLMWLHEGVFAVLTFACVQVLILAPIVFRFSRLSWIYLDYRTDPHSRPGAP